MLKQLWQTPIPTRSRSSIEHPLQWIPDAIFALILFVTGSGVAGLLTTAMPFLGKLAYPTAMFVALFPTLLWMHYCHIGFNGIKTTKSAIILAAIFFLWVIAKTVVIDVIENGSRIIWMVPISALIIAIALPAESIVGKILLARLPAAKRLTRINTQPSTDRDITM